ncbi:mycofactocin dehydrogenase MftG [Nesterenkonia ebinurensis]|uniref:mycofactocin dehydrogenase MftG n=1 Tax=Nesterenkonia ebinurensis TaxID=2608252 RepID=UPI00123C8885|nr:mycofactocin system GMC family oxidoreductase MftG [Nesterenkonia ebinurensis]
MKYDVVIVGGGTAGSVLAARLSENPERSVLLLEAGPAPRSRSEIDDAAANGTSLHAASTASSLTWQFPARLTASRSVTAVRGKILGGSSAINGGYFVRARPEDFDYWSAVGDTTWSYDQALPLLGRMETDLDFGNHPQHGASGPMLIKRAWTAVPAEGLNAVFAAAARAAGHTYNADLNDAASHGVGPVPSTVVNGVRHNAAMQYLFPVLDRPNLKVIGATRALSVKIRKGKAVGVECAVDSGSRQSFFEAGEVVLSAGALSTPQLLMLSGIGVPDQLRSISVAPVVETRGVGRGLSDHPDLALNLEVSARALCSTPQGSQPGPGFSAALHFSAETTGTAHELELLIATTPSHELFGGEARQDEVQEHLLMLGLMTPTFRGSLRLRSADPLQMPSIDYNYLHTAADWAALRAGVRRTFQLLGQPAMQEVLLRTPRLERNRSNQNVLDNEHLLDAWIANHIGTRFHTSGGAQMGPEDDPESVVDTQGRVHQVQGLRVADLSILPKVPRRGTANTAVFIGELISDFMK